MVAFDYPEANSPPHKRTEQRSTATGARSCLDMLTIRRGKLLWPWDKRGVGSRPSKVREIKNSKGDARTTIVLCKDDKALASTAKRERKRDREGESLRIISLIDFSRPESWEVVVVDSSCFQCGRDGESERERERKVWKVFRAGEDLIEITGRKIYWNMNEFIECYFWCESCIGSNSVWKICCGSLNIMRNFHFVVWGNS